LLIGKTGEVVAAKMVAGHPSFEKGVLENIKRWRFKCFNCASPEEFTHLFEYEFKVTNRECGDALVSRREYSFPDKVTVTEETAICASRHPIGSY
jgi:hypothetical protein